MEDLDANWMEDDGRPKLDDMKELISNLVAVKRERANQEMQG